MSKQRNVLSIILMPLMFLGLIVGSGIYNTFYIDFNVEAPNLVGDFPGSEKMKERKVKSNPLAVFYTKNDLSRMYKSLKHAIEI